jgi:hypothetical protein
MSPKNIEHRAKHFQACAFREGNCYFTGSIPDARTELAIVDLIAVAEWIKEK